MFKPAVCVLFENVGNVEFGRLDDDATLVVISALAINVELFANEEFKLLGCVLLENIEDNWLVTFNDDGMVTIVFWSIETDEPIASVLLGPGEGVVFDGMNIV